MADFVDNEAREKASEAWHGLNNHIQITEVHFRNLHTRFDQLMSVLKWAGGLIVMLFISALSWSLAQQYNSNESTKKDLQAQVELLREQQRNSATARQERGEILNRLAAGGTESASVPISSGER